MPIKSKNRRKIELLISCIFVLLMFSSQMRNSAAFYYLSFAASADHSNAIITEDDGSLGNQMGIIGDINDHNYESEYGFERFMEVSPNTVQTVVHVMPDPAHISANQLADGFSFAVFLWGGLITQFTYGSGLIDYHGRYSISMSLDAMASWIILSSTEFDEGDLVIWDNQDDLRIVDKTLFDKILPADDSRTKIEKNSGWAGDKVLYQLQFMVKLAESEQLDPALGVYLRFKTVNEFSGNPPWWGKFDCRSRASLSELVFQFNNMPIFSTSPVFKFPNEFTIGQTFKTNFTFKDKGVSYNGQINLLHRLQ